MPGNRSAPCIVKLSATKVFATFYDGSQSWFVIGTVTGTGIVWGTPDDTNVPAGDIKLTPLALTAAEAVLCYTDGTNFSAIAGTISGTTFTPGTPDSVDVSANPPTGSQFSLAAVGSGGFVAAWLAGTPSTIAQAVAGTASTTTVALGAIETISQQAGGQAPQIAVLSTSTVVFNGSGFTQPTRATISGTTLTPTLGATLQLPFLQGTTNVNTNGAYQWWNWPSIAAVSATLYTWQDPAYTIYESDTSGNTSPGIIHLGLPLYALLPIDAARVLAVLMDWTTALFARVIAVNAINSAPIGLTAAGASDTNPVTVQNGGQLTGLSGLTPKKQYYISGDGSLTLTNTGHQAGVATSATTMAVNIQNAG